MIPENELYSEQNYRQDKRQLKHYQRSQYIRSTRNWRHRLDNKKHTHTHPCFEAKPYCVALARTCCLAINSTTFRIAARPAVYTMHCTAPFYIIRKCNYFLFALPMPRGRGWIRLRVCHATQCGTKDARNLLVMQWSCNRLRNAPCPHAHTQRRQLQVDRLWINDVVVVVVVIVVVVVFVWQTIRHTLTSFADAHTHTRALITCSGINNRWRSTRVRVMHERTNRLGLLAWLWRVCVCRCGTEEWVRECAGEATSAVRQVN